MTSSSTSASTPVDEDLGLSIFLAILVLCLFVLFPITGALGLGRVLISIGLTGVLISGIFAALEGRLWRRLTLLLAVLAGLAEWLSHAIYHDALEAIKLIAMISFTALATYSNLARVLRQGRITWHRIQGAIAVYLLLGLIWTFAYALADLLVPGSFGLAPESEGSRFSQLLYFSYVTLTTLGYGDIAPQTVAARTLAVTEALVGQLFLAVLVARLVSLEIAHSRSDRSPS